MQLGDVPISGVIRIGGVEIRLGEAQNSPVSAPNLKRLEQERDALLEALHKIEKEMQKLKGEDSEGGHVAG